MAQPEEQQPPLEYVSDTQEAEGEVTSGTTQEQKPAEENQPDDIHDADVSDSESCCSVVSDAQGLSTRLNTRRPPKTLRSGTEVVSKAESCAPVSATPRRSTRSQKKENPLGCDSEAESCSSVMSASKSGGTRVLTRSQKKTVLTKSASHTEDTELSEHDSARDDLRMSTLRKSTRSRRAKPLEPVPIDFDDSGDASSSSVSRRTPGRKAKAIPTEISKDDKPAPSPRRVIRTRVKDATVRVTSDSESDIAGYSSVGSPSGTPCSSRTGSASRNCAVIITRSLHVDAKHASSPLRAEAQTPCQGDAPMSDAIETEEKVEVEKHEATVIVTSEEGQTSLLAEEADEDKTLIAMEEGEKEDKVEEAGGVTVFAPAALKAVENADSARPSVVVTEAECPDTEMTEEISPVVKDQSETVALKGSVVVSEEREEDAKSDLVVVDDTVKTTRADTVSLTVSEVAEADTTEDVDEENDELLNATEDQTCTKQSVKVTAELDGNVAENAEKEKATELNVPCEQIVKVTLCEAPKEEVLDEISAHADSGIQDAAEEDQEPNGPDPTSLKSVQVTDEEDQPMEVDPTDQQEEVESLACGSSSVDLKGSAGWQCKDGSEQPTGSGTLRKPAAVSLLDSSDEEEEEDNSDVCSLTMEPAAGQEASESEEEDENDLAARAKPKAMAQIQSSDGLFVIDTQPGVHSSQMFHMEERPAVEEGDGPERGDEMMEEAKGIEEEEEFVDEEEDEEDEDGKVLFTSRNTALEKLSCGIDPGLRMKELGGLYVSFDGGKSKKVSKSQNSLKDHKHLDELMKKSVIVPDFEKKHSIPPYKESLNATKLKRRVERQKTTGDGWFNMKAPELTEELKNDLKALQMRSAMDPKRFYKKNDREGFAKYVQVGTVVDSPVDFYNSRIPKKERKRTIVEELMADAEFRSYNKRKYQEIMSERAAQLAGKKHWKKKSKSK